MSATPLHTVPEHVDVLIVGAGISGIGAAFHLQDKLPHRSYAILEGRDALGGTWDLFRYPGIRSDSDLPTLGYAFKPWRGEKAIADGPAIREYVEETATQYGIKQNIRFGHHVSSVAWSSEDARWTVQATRKATGESVTFTCGWLFSASGYYRYDEGYTPEFAGREDFAGQIIHPQHWPEDLDYAGKKVVVIGSGATAVTLVPAMARDAAHVTMLQRSPTYILTVPEKDDIANVIRKVAGPEKAHSFARTKNVWLQKATYGLARSRPGLTRRLIRGMQKLQLPRDFDIDTHFNPSYDPWDQRLCVVPNGDLFKSIRKGKASVVTDHIDRFTATGIRTRSGQELEADIIITATGLNLQAFGGVDMTVDGSKVAPADTVAYRGMMLSGVPNFAYALGYTNASWTLKVDLVCDRLTRTLAHMDLSGTDVCLPVAAEDMPTKPLLDLASGYVQRALDQLPKQGDRAPWSQPMSYASDRVSYRDDAVDDGELRFTVAAQKPKLARVA